MHFCPDTKCMDSVLKLVNDLIQFAKEAKLFGLIWNTKITFEPHIKYLKTRCKKSLNILKVLSRTEWGADQTTLLKLYHSLVRSYIPSAIASHAFLKNWMMWVNKIHTLRETVITFHGICYCTTKLQWSAPFTICLCLEIRRDHSIDGRTDGQTNCYDPSNSVGAFKWWNYGHNNAIRISSVNIQHAVGSHDLIYPIECWYIVF